MVDTATRALLTHAPNEGNLGPPRRCPGVCESVALACWAQVRGCPQGVGRERDLVQVHDRKPTYEPDPPAPSNGTRDPPRVLLAAIVR